MAFFRALPWHEGEDKIHQLTRVPTADNPTHPTLSQFLARRVAASPTIALGTVDSEGQIWCTIWGGDIPIAQSVAPGGVIGVRAQVDASFDPVVEALYVGKDDGEVVRHDPKAGVMVSGLSIHLEERDRVKLFGRMLAGSLNADESVETLAEIGNTKATGRIGSAQLVLQITQSLGNCPKYINKKKITSYNGAKPRLLSDSSLLTDEAIAHVHAADLFFVASRGPEDMDCNHRGGPPGFVRVQQPTNSCSQSSVLIWPEYSGNNLYQTLGNITYDSHAGIVIPNFSNGNILYLSGTAEILIDKAATAIISKTKLAVRFTVTAARFVADGLNFRGTPCTNNEDRSSSNPVTSHSITDGQSPYNPRVRYLTSEISPQAPASTISTLPPDEYRNRYGSVSSEPELSATLIRKTKLTPTISRYRFRLTASDPNSLGPNMSPLWSPGQYAALDFSDELYMGYSHMNDSDPTALNDDFIRTFTVSSIFTASREPEFEIVVRSVGTVTNWLSHQNDRSGMTKVGVRGFAGDFRFEAPQITGDESRRNVFIAAGIGITPLLGQISVGEVEAGLNGLTVLWTLNIVDIGLANDVIKAMPASLKKRLRLFVTGTEKESKNSEYLKRLAEVEEVVESYSDGAGFQVYRRRLTKDDLISLEKGQGNFENWYLCTAPNMRKQIQDWLSGRTVIFENFDY